eukprot:491283_1
MRTHENYKTFINAINILQRLINDDGGKGIKLTICQEEMNTMNDIINALLTNNYNNIPIYIKTLLHQWINDVTRIDIHLNTIEKYANEIIFYEALNEPIIRIDTLNQIFKNIEVIRLSYGHLNENASKSYWIKMVSMLDTINKLQFSKLTTIEFHRRTVDLETYVCNNWNLKEEAVHKWILYRMNL